MKVGLIGAGNMAAALARGWGDPVLCTDSGSGRAQALADELGGEAAGSNYELAVNADVVILAHKPAQLEAGRRARPRRRARAVVSLLARVTVEQLRAAYPDTPVVRVQPNTPAEVGRGVTLLAEPAEDPLGSEVEELFGARRHRRAPAGVAARRRRRPARASAPRTGRCRRGVGRRRDPPRHPRGAREAARDRDDGRQRRAAARPRPRHASGCAARSPRRAGRPRGAWPRSSAAACAPPSPPPWTTSWGPPDGAARRLRRRRWSSSTRSASSAGWCSRSSSRSACASPTTASSSAIMDFLRDVSNPFLNLFRRLPLQIGPLDLTPDGRDHRPADRRRHHRRPDRPEPLISGTAAARAAALASPSWRPTRPRRRSCARQPRPRRPRRRLPGRRARPRAQPRRRVRAVRRRRAGCSS